MSFRWAHNHSVGFVMLKTTLKSSYSAHSADCIIHPVKMFGKKIFFFFFFCELIQFCFFFFFFFHNTSV